MEIVIIFTAIIILTIVIIIYIIANNLHKYDKEYDNLLNNLMDEDTPVAVEYLTIRFVGTKLVVWAGNYPYNYGSTYPNKTHYASMKTRRRLVNYILRQRLAKANKRIAKYVNKIDELENKINKLQKDIICMKSHNIYKITTT